MTPNEMRTIYTAKVNEIVAPLGNRTNAKGALLRDKIIEFAPDGLSTIKRWEDGVFGEKFAASKLEEIYSEAQKARWAKRGEVLR